VTGRVLPAGACLGNQERWQKKGRKNDRLSRKRGGAAQKEHDPSTKEQQQLLTSIRHTEIGKRPSSRHVRGEQAAARG